MEKLSQENIFDYLKSIYYKKDIKYNKKIAPAYLLSLWLSHDKSLIDIVQKVNFLHFYLSDELIYKYYFYTVPKGGRFIKWTKKDKSKLESKELDEIRTNYNLSKRESKMLLDHIRRIKEIKE